MLKWSLERCEGRGEAVQTTVGWVPTPPAIDYAGLQISDKALETLLRVDPLEWHEAVQGQYEYFEKFGEHAPAGIWQEHAAIARRVAGF